jgi:hypothetical protein
MKDASTDSLAFVHEALVPSEWAAMARLPAWSGRVSFTLFDLVPLFIFALNKNVVGPA